MKLLFFDDFKLGVLKGDSVVDVSDVVRDKSDALRHNRRRVVQSDPLTSLCTPCIAHQTA